MERDEAVLEGYLGKVPAIDTAAAKMAQSRLDGLAKPLGSLGVLEEMAARICGITGEAFPAISPRSLLVMAADNGVVAEGVSGSPQEITATQTRNLARGVTGAAVLARCYDTRLVVVDVGVDADLSGTGVVNRKIRRSTGNIAKEPAMTRAQAVSAVIAGIEAAREACNSGSRLLGVGEMGIGNTTTGAAVLCALTGMAPEEAVGFGGGLTTGAYKKKIRVVQEALALHKPDWADPMDVLRTVGGLDIAAMAGVFIGAAGMRCPVAVDGFISAVAALAACRLCPEVRHFLLASHRSREPGFERIMDELELAAPLDLKLRLGEGSGCPLLFSLLDGAFAVYRNMASFDEAGIDDSYKKPLVFMAKDTDYLKG